MLAVFAISSKQVAEQESDIALEVNRIGSTSGKLSFTYTTTDGTAKSGEDYEATSGQINWDDGENASKTIVVTLLDNNEEEELETFTIALSSVDGSRLGTNSEVVVTIADNDKNQAPAVTVTENFQVNTDQQVTLSATAEDPDNDSMTYLWEQTTGTSVSLANTNQLTANFTAPSSAGSLAFKFTATDYRGASTSSNVTVTVVAPVTPPPPAPPTPPAKSSGGGLPWLVLLLLPMGISRRLK